MAVKKKVNGKLVLILVMGTMLFYIGGQIFSYTNKKIRSEQVIEDTIYDFVRAEGIVFRDEVLVPKQGSGVIVYNYADGEEVAQTANVASVYHSEETAKIKSQIEDLQSELASLQKVQGSSSATFAGINIVSNLTTQINNQAVEIMDIADSGIVEGISAEREELSMLMNRKKIAMGAEDTFSERISYLQTQLSYLQSLNPTPYLEIETPSEGYFTKTVDGYETIYTVDKLEELTCASFEDLLKREPVTSNSSSLGKVVKTHVWYFGVELEEKEAQKFEQGDKVRLDFKFSNGKTVQAKVTQIVPDRNRKKAVILFECKDVTDRLLNVRKQSVDIIFNTYSGLRVSSKALYHENNVPGVYVLDKTTIHFKPVNVIKNNGDYLLCEPDASTDSDHRLSLLDSVIIESGGVVLKDGKQLNENVVEGVESTNATTG